MKTEFTSFEDIKRAGKVVPFEEVERLLKKTEPLRQHFIDTDGSYDVRVTMPDDWNVGMKQMDDTSLTSCKIIVQDVPYILTKRAILSLLSLIGISDRYALKTPGNLMEPHVNYWIHHNGPTSKGTETQVLLLTKEQYAVGFTSPRLPVISNLTVLEEIKKYIRQHHSNKEFYVDPNVVNNYTQTDFRLILKNPAFEVKTKRNGTNQTDVWHYGIHVTNSLISKITRPLALEGFMVEERSLAGIIPEYASLVGFSRQNSLDIDDLKGWVGSTLEQIFDVLPNEAELVQQMPKHSFHGKVGVLTTDLFQSMKIHRKVQEAALENLTVSGDMTSYGVMHALAKAVSGSSDLKLLPQVVSHVQKVSGALPHRAEEFCNSCGRLHMHG